MEFTACHRFAKIAPRKARLVADLIRGESVNEALEILRLTRKRACVFIGKVVKSAVAAAGENHDVDPEALFIERVWVDGGPMRRKTWARPRGMWAIKRSRTSHIHVVLSDETGEGPEEEEQTEA